MKNIEIGSFKIGASHKPFLIAEVAQTHDGSLGLAHAFIDAVADSGADAIKFQTHIAEAESTPAEPFRVKFSYQDQSRYDYWKRMEFTAEQWAGLAKHAQEKGLIFLSSPFSLQAVELLARIGMPAWKIGSGEVSNLPLIEAVLNQPEPILLSSGLSSKEELNEVIALIQLRNKAFALFQCTSEYPCPPEHMGLNLIEEYAKRWDCPVGLSDHSGRIYASLAAVALGACMVEIHVALSKAMFGPDVSASITMEELSALSQGISDIHRMKMNPVVEEQKLLSPHYQNLKQIFGRGIYAKADLDAGHRIAFDDLAFKKPNLGLPAKDYRKILGKRLSKPLKKDDLFCITDIES